MSIMLTDAQHACRDAARQFAARVLDPWAGRIDSTQTTPDCVLSAVRDSGYLGAALPELFGGGGLDPLSYGLVTEEIGKVCSSVRSLLTVHNMAAQAIARFGSNDQQERWLPSLCCGRKLIAFALSEPDVGSAAHSLQTQVLREDGSYRLSGTKKWVTYGQVADQFLVFARLGDDHVALVVDRDSEGLEIEPITDMFGVRGSMLAQLHLHAVRIDRDCQLGRTGMGLRFVANFALDHGRFSVAWGSTGIIQACLDTCLSYTQKRQQGDSKLADFQLIRRQLSDMLVAHTASRALCHRCSVLREQGDPRAPMETSLSKYHAATAAIRVATDAVHMLAANGCSCDYPVSRYLRDATVAGIVEGTHEAHQLALANYAFQRPYLV